MLRRFFSLPMHHPMGLGILIVIALAVIFVPSVTPNDWELNTNPLFAGLGLYQSHEFVYPPWSLILLWPYRLLTAVGARIAVVLVLGALFRHRAWSIGRFLALVLNPFFIFSMLYSNLDVLVLTFPILIWEMAAKSRWTGLFWGLALSLLLLKPQGALLLVPYLVWQERQQWKNIGLAFAIAALVTLPISLLGSPPLLLQWLDNISHPSAQNLAYWSANNISLTGDVGLIFAIPILLLCFGALYGLMRYFGKAWTKNHSYTALILTSLLLSPYSSNQSIIAAFAFAPSMTASILQYALTALGNITELYLRYVPFWVIAFGLVALWFLPVADEESNGEA